MKKIPRWENCRGIIFLISKILAVLAQLEGFRKLADESSGNDVEKFNKNREFQYRYCENK